MQWYLRNKVLFLDVYRNKNTGWYMIKSHIKLEIKPFGHYGRFDHVTAVFDHVPTPR